jgi:uncharacterized protein YdeI (YjbR/CyaY-like superfamily)
MPAKKMSEKGRISEKDLEKYMKGNSEEIIELFYQVRSFILKSDKRYTEAFKWSHPCYFIEGRLIHYLSPASKHLTFGFWQGAEMKDPKGLLEGTGKNMRHVKIYSISDCKNKDLQNLMEEAKME